MSRSEGTESVGQQQLPLGGTTDTGTTGKDAPVAERRLMERVLEKENMIKAHKRVKQNGGSAGVDGMIVERLTDHLMKHWPKVRQTLLEGTYQPRPVKRVMSPQARRRRTAPWHSDRPGQTYPAGIDAGIAAGLGRNVLRAQLRVSAEQNSPSGSRGSPEVPPVKRPHLGRRHGPGEVLRPGGSIPGVLGVKSYLVPDDKIVRDVAGALGAIEHEYGVKFFTGVQNGVVGLNVEVGRASVRNLAEKSAANIPGVRGVINSVRASGVDLEAEDQRFLQPSIGAQIYLHNGILGTVQRVVINPNNRRVVAMVVRGRFSKSQE